MLFVCHPKILDKHCFQFLTPKRNWRQCLCKFLGWQTKSIMSVTVFLEWSISANHLFLHPFFFVLCCFFGNLFRLCSLSLSSFSLCFSFYKHFYYIDTDEIPAFFLSLKNHIFIARSEDTILIFNMWGYYVVTFL